MDRTESADLQDETGGTKGLGCRARENIEQMPHTDDGTNLGIV
jgi:hypothetical protein